MRVRPVCDPLREDKQRLMRRILHELSQGGEFARDFPCIKESFYSQTEVATPIGAGIIEVPKSDDVRVDLRAEIRKATSKYMV